MTRSTGRVCAPRWLQLCTQYRGKKLDALHSEAISATDRALKSFYQCREAANETLVGAAEEAQIDAGGAACVAANEVFATVPTTLAGMRAKIDFARHVDHVAGLLMHTGETDTLRDFLNSLHEAAHLMAA